MKCEKCEYENPPGKMFCEKCGHKLVLRPAPDPGPGREAVQVLLDKIEALQKELSARQTEIEKLQNEVDRLSKERDELVGNHPELRATLQKLDEKEAQLEAALLELKKLREAVDTAPEPQPLLESQGLGSYLHIESHPIRNPKWDLILAQDRHLVDLSASPFQIRASLERTPKGFDLVVHDGATINIKVAGSKLWKRYAGGARVSADAGMVLFDNAGLMNARLEWRAESGRRSD